MGCQLSKVIGCNSSDAPVAGGVGAEDSDGQGEPLAEPPPPAPTDPRLPLTAREKFRITKSWKAISRAMEPTGVNMFLSLFQTHSDLLSLFSKFRDLKSRDSQAESLELSQHAETVMAALDEGIKGLDNVDFLFDLLHQIGASHTKINGFKREYFWKIQDPFLEAVQLTLGDRYSEDIAKIYQTTIKFLIETIIEGFDIANGYKKEAIMPSSNQKELVGKIQELRKYGSSSPERESIKENVNNLILERDA